MYGSDRIARDHLINVFARGDDAIGFDFTRSVRPCGRNTSVSGLSSMIDVISSCFKRLPPRPNETRCH